VPGPSRRSPVRADVADIGDAPPSRARLGSPRFRRLRVVAALVVREMGTRFGRSTGGYFWALAEPLGGILLLAVAFSLALRSPPIGTSFMLFYATGMIPFSMFRTMSSGVAAAIISNRGLLTYPVVTTLDAVLAKFVLNFMTIALVAAILFSGIILGLGLHVNLDLAAVALAIGMAAALGLGIGTLNCVLFGFFPTWKNLWSVLNRPLFIISGIFFTYEMVPPAFQAVLWWNPIVHIIGVMRAGFYGTYDARYVSYPYVLGIGLVTFVVGAYLLRRHASALIER
jgi:capsular polysaccharide transport system permease protein